MAARRSERLANPAYSTYSTHDSMENHAGVWTTLITVRAAWECRSRRPPVVYQPLLATCGSTWLEPVWAGQGSPCTGNRAVMVTVSGRPGWLARGLGPLEYEGGSFQPERGQPAGQGADVGPAVLP